MRGDGAVGCARDATDETTGQKCSGVAAIAAVECLTYESAGNSSGERSNEIATKRSEVSPKTATSSANLDFSDGGSVGDLDKPRKTGHLSILIEHVVSCQPQMVEHDCVAVCRGIEVLGTLNGNHPQLTGSGVWHDRVVQVEKGDAGSRDRYEKATDFRRALEPNGDFVP